MTEYYPVDTVEIQPNAAMMPTAWIGYDAYGRIVGSGVMGLGNRVEPGSRPGVRIVCGSEVPATARHALAVLRDRGQCRTEGAPRNFRYWRVLP